MAADHSHDQIYLLTKTYNPYLVGLSWCISLLGAHTTTQLICQTYTTGRIRKKLMWISLASIMFGGCCTWSMHFIGMLALSTGVPFWFNIPITIASAGIAISAAFIALGSGLWMEMLRRRRFRDFLPLSVSTPDVGTPDDDDRGSVDFMSHHNSYSQGGESHSSSTRAELEALLAEPEDYADALGDSWAKKYLVTRLLWTAWYSLTLENIVRGLALGLVFVTMHYSGMHAMRFDGFIMWNGWLVFLSFLVSWLTCQIAVIFMPTRIHASRQAYFSIIAATGACSLHWVGMAAATFYTFLPPPHDNLGAGDSALPFIISVVVIGACILSYVLLIHSVNKSRLTFAEMIQTKREMWKVIAQKNAAEQASREKTEFISIASHELRTPLYAISGFTELLEHSNLTDEQYAYVHAIKTASLTVKIITDNVLDFSRLEHNSAEMKARPVYVDVRELAWTSVIGIALPNSQTELLLWVKDDVPDTVFLDEVYCTRILMNLLSNSVKFTTSGYIFVTVSFQDNFLVFSVKDTGIGIRKKLCDAIFEPFVQADTSLTRRHQGSGLGLSISRELVRRMGGDIKLQSEEGKGTEIIFQLPITVGNKTLSRPTPPRIDSMSWSIPPVRKDRPPPARQVPIKSVALYTRNAQARELFSSLVGSFDVELADTDADPLHIDQVDHDAVCIGMELFEEIPALCLKLLGPEKLPVFVLYSEKERGAFFTSVAEADNVILVRRPLAIHRLVQCLREPWKYMGGRSIPRKQSSTPTDTIQALSMTSERQEVAAKAAETANTVRFETDFMTDEHKIPMPEPKTVLMVEDNQVNGKMGLKLLSIVGYKAELAEDGAVALDMIIKNESKYDVVLMDCQMPVMDGLECTRRIRELEKDNKLPGHLPIIALTANAGAEVDCMAAGSDAFITKPLTGATLSKAIERVLSKWEDE